MKWQIDWKEVDQVYLTAENARTSVLPLAMDVKKDAVGFNRHVGARNALNLEAEDLAAVLQNAAIVKKHLSVKADELRREILKQQIAIFILRVKIAIRRCQRATKKVFTATTRAVKEASRRLVMQPSGRITRLSSRRRRSDRHLEAPAQRGRRS